MAWSFNLLNGAEQILFARVSVFAGPFSLDAVEMICTDESLDASSAARVLAALVDKSMVQRADAAGSGYRVLEPLRQFGAAELRESERAAVADRHATWYLGLAERSSESMAGPDEPEASARLDREFGNLRAAYSHLAEQHDVERCARLVAALREYSFRSMRAEVISWADEVIAMPGFDDSLRAPVVLATSAYGRFVRGDHLSSIEYADRAVAARTRLGVSSSGLAERVLGNSWFYRGEAEIAQQWIDRMLDDASTGSPARLAHALYMRSVASTSIGDPRRGTSFAERALCGGPPLRFADRARSGACTRSGCRSKATTPRRRPTTSNVRPTSRSPLATAGFRRSPSPRSCRSRPAHGSSPTALAGFADVIDMWFRGGDWANQWLSLRHVFGILVQLGDKAAAATLHGVLAAIGAAYALPFEASDAERIDALVEELRDEMRPAEFATAVRRGTSMSDSEIVDFVQGRIRVLTAVAE